MKMEHLTRALLWRVAANCPEMVETRTYYREGLILPLPQKDINTICEVGNLVFERLGSHLRLASTKGMIIPTQVIPFG